MILIIDDYFTPADRIKNFLYKNKTLKPFSGEEMENTVYFVHAECVSDLDRLRHLAEEVVEVRNGKVFVVNKKRRNIVWYRIEGKALVREEEPLREARSGNRNLPHLKAQENEMVLFPSDEE